jgi:undecaprenyl-diphosphatase
LATYLSILLKKNLKWFPYVIFVWAAVVAYSRIYLGVHFPIDILVGAFVGSLLGVVFSALAKKVINKQKITS